MKFSSISIILIVLLTLQLGCKSLPDNPPVAPEKMSKVLLDMQIAETYSLGLGDSVTNKFEKNYDSLSVFYRSVLKKYDISFEDFKDAMQWYEARPLKMDSLLSNVLNQLSEIKAKEKIKNYDPNAENKPVINVDSLNKHKDTSIKKDLRKRQNLTDTTTKRRVM
ncbi:DUF4296 domain-containing protein [Taibaiella lutea]|uniref:DUF4296 domain-containing protein n=1 Tax=Taibaiella lutea TaxID=2608001 RepID=A0A5M6CGN1_9BACT|nr:DUF4296 domain-containing protein [Taibaiella lutea]KAA5532279.1 DUF4296 domain-containing protein [Taibaiella lutea]